MLEEFLRAFGLIFLAEMGDKTQIIAMTFATKYLLKDVFAGIALGVIANHGLAILLGSLLSSIIPMDMVQVLAGGLFIIFGLSSLSIDDEEEEESKQKVNPLITVALAFFLGELGDKTQLTAMTLSIDGTYPLIILAGTTCGMLATSSLGIFVGKKIGDKIPDLFIKLASSIIFIFFGAIKLYPILSSYGIKVFVLFIMGILVIELISAKKLIDHSKKVVSPMKKAAKSLKDKTLRLEKSIEDLCLGLSTCKSCMGGECLVGYIKLIIKNTLEKEDYYNNDLKPINELTIKSYNSNDLLKSISLILVTLEEERMDFGDSSFFMNQTRGLLERAIFKTEIKNINTVKEYLEEVNRINPTYKEQLEVYIKINREEEL